MIPICPFCAQVLTNIENDVIRYEGSDNYECLKCLSPIKSFSMHTPFLLSKMTALFFNNKLWSTFVILEPDLFAIAVDYDLGKTEIGQYISSHGRSRLAPFINQQGLGYETLVFTDEIMDIYSTDLRDQVKIAATFS